MSFLRRAAQKGGRQTITYSTYMNGLCKVGRVDESFELVDKMPSNELRPNDIMNIVLDGVCPRTTAWAAKCILECSTELGWHANVVNYNTVMRRLCDERKWSAVVKLFDGMLKKGITPNSWTFNIVIHSLCKLGKTHHALCLLGSKEFVPDVVTYNTLIRHLSFIGKTNETYLLFHEMTKKGIAPNDITYRLLVHCLCREDKFLVEFNCFGNSVEHGTSLSALSVIVHFSHCWWQASRIAYSDRMGRYTRFRNRCMYVSVNNHCFL
jgi:pentatricopeptide repeat protein